MTTEEFKTEFDKIVSKHIWNPDSATKEDVKWLIDDLEELLEFWKTTND